MLLTLAGLSAHSYASSAKKPGDGPAANADGIDIDACQGVLVEDSYFSVADDAICVKSGIDWFGRCYPFPSNITRD